jgi:cardiolipin synthase
LIVTGISIFAITDVHIEMKPSLVSKCTTVAQLSTIFLTLLDPQIPGAHAIKSSLFWITAGLTITSGLHYIYFGLNVLQNASGKN